MHEQTSRLLVWYEWNFSLTSGPIVWPAVKGSFRSRVRSEDYERVVSYSGTLNFGLISYLDQFCLWQMSRGWSSRFHWQTSFKYTYVYVSQGVVAYLYALKLYHPFFRTKLSTWTRKSVHVYTQNPSGPVRVLWAYIYIFCFLGIYIYILFTNSHEMRESENRDQRVC